MPAGSRTGARRSVASPRDRQRRELAIDNEEFVTAVADMLGGDRAVAERAIDATLRTLAERLSTEQARHLVELLPPELGPALFHVGRPERLDIDAFVQHTAEREGVDLDTARRHSAVVLAVLARAIGPDEFDRLAATLPKNFAPLLPRGPDVQVAAFDDIVVEVAERAGLEPDEAQACIEDVLAVLAERIAPGEVEDLIAHLPLELHPVLKGALTRNPGHASHVPLDDFLQRVAARRGVDASRARDQAHAVLTTLRKAVGDDEFFDVTVELPPEYAQLWQ
jgi:uncharacterized protein (DUF2267 family)